MQTSDLIQSLRKSYETGTLEEANLRPDPIDLFREWMDAAVAAQLDEPNAMTLCTASADGMPDGRIVLLRSFDERGFVFFTNYESRKGNHLLANPQAALVFLWHPLERQVRIQGAVARVSAAESDAYFRTRPRGHQLAAWTSSQSQPLAARAELDARLADLDTRFPAEVPLPDFWGGYRLVPQRIEFWQGRRNRLHDRFAYTTVEGAWTVTRLAP
jgi:pyridoxamine 5'-phosphate oxidase